MCRHLCHCTHNSHHVDSVCDSILDRACRHHVRGRACCCRWRWWRNVKRLHPDRWRWWRRGHRCRHRTCGDACGLGDRVDRIRRSGWELLTRESRRQLEVRDTRRHRGRLRRWMRSCVRRSGRKCRWRTLGAAAGNIDAVIFGNCIERDEHHRVRQQWRQVVPPWRVRGCGLCWWRWRWRCHPDRWGRDATGCEQFERCGRQRRRGPGQRLANGDECRLRIRRGRSGPCRARRGRHERRHSEWNQLSRWCGH